MSVALRLVVKQLRSLHSVPWHGSASVHSAYDIRIVYSKPQPLDIDPKVSISNKNNVSKAPEFHTSSTIDPSDLYRMLEEAMVKRRLEEPQCLRAVLMLVVRERVHGADSIRFPMTDTEMCLLLKSNGIPEGMANIYRYLQIISEERSMIIDFSRIAKQMYRSWGRVVFTPSLPYPTCYSVTYSGNIALAKQPNAAENLVLRAEIVVSNAKPRDGGEGWNFFELNEQLW